MTTNVSNPPSGSNASRGGPGHQPRDSNLGLRKAVFRGRPIGIRSWFLIFIPGGLIVISGFGYGTFLARNALIEHGLALALVRAQYWFTMASVLLILLLIYFVHRLLISLQHFEVFDQGVIRRTYFLRKVHYRWSDFSGITSASTTFNLGRWKIRSSPRAILHLRSGKSIDLTNSFRGIPRLVKILKSKIYPIIWPMIKSNFRSGRSIKFGQITIDRETIMIAKLKIPWTAVNQVGIVDGFLVIELRDNSTQRAPVSSISNLELLLNTINWGITA